MSEKIKQQGEELVSRSILSLLSSLLYLALRSWGVGVGKSICLRFFLRQIFLLQTCSMVALLEPLRFFQPSSVVAAVCQALLGQAVGLEALWIFRRKTVLPAGRSEAKLLKQHYLPRQRYKFPAGMFLGVKEQMVSPRRKARQTKEDRAKEEEASLLRKHLLWKQEPNEQKNTSYQKNKLSV